MSKPKLLWVGDACCPTGFARVTHNIVPYLQKSWEVSVLGVNHHGDPHPYPYPIYPAQNNGRGDMWGVSRINYLIEKLKPEVIVVNNDPWNVIKFLDQTKVPIVSYMPIDAPNVKPLIAEHLNKAALNICYTWFGANELLNAGLSDAKVAVVSHGVDTQIYRPMNKTETRAKLGFSDLIPANAYIVGNVNRNQPRKRLDLTIMCFAQWVKKYNLPGNVFLMLHCGLEDIGWDLFQLAEYFIGKGRLLVTGSCFPDQMGAEEKDLPYVYNCFDVQISTTMGEGWGLTTHEGMACGIPQIVPNWAALGEWPKDAVRYVPIASLEATSGSLNTLGGVVDETAMVKALQQMYQNKDLRDEYSVLAYQRATEDRFKWSSVARELDYMLKDALGAPRSSLEPKTATKPLNGAKSSSSGLPGPSETVSVGGCY